MGKQKEKESKTNVRNNLDQLANVICLDARLLCKLSEVKETNEENSWIPFST